MIGVIRVKLVRAWARRHEFVSLELPEGSTALDALAAAGWPTGPVAVFGERVDGAVVLADGDRIEMLRPLIADPKEARRRRAGKPTR